MNTTKSLGNYGEDVAVKFLEQHNYQILHRNWHCQYGEIDIVASKDNIISFVEVKTRRNNAESSLISITEKKRQRLVDSAHIYLYEHQLEDCIWQIDAIAVYVIPHQAPVVQHVEDALGW